MSMSRADIWTELSPEEQATVGPLSRIRLGLDADPRRPTKPRWAPMPSPKRHDDEACEADPCDTCVASAAEVCDPIQEV